MDSFITCHYIHSYHTPVHIIVKYGLESWQALAELCQSGIDIISSQYSGQKYLCKVAC